MFQNQHNEHVQPSQNERRKNKMSKSIGRFDELTDRGHPSDTAVGLVIAEQIERIADALENAGKSASVLIDGKPITELAGNHD
jgi:uncharacterized protein Yka (UPF0111/DUF47 family)